jgi:hypothetical protein
LLDFFSLGVCWRTPEAISRRISLCLFFKSSWYSRKVEVTETQNFWQILRVDNLRGDVTLEIYFACWIFLAWVYADKPLKLFQEEFNYACSSKARGKAAKSRYWKQKFFWQILRVDDLRGDVTLEIYFACWIF